MAMFPAMHRVVVPVAPHAPLFELAVPCEVFGLERAGNVKDWYGSGCARSVQARRRPVSPRPLDTKGR
jgi:hypothetical protein